MVGILLFHLIFAEISRTFQLLRCSTCSAEFSSLLIVYTVGETSVNCTSLANYNMDPVSQ